MGKDVIIIFDIGKTNKKVLLFDQGLNVISEREHRFEEILDDDGFACDDIAKIEDWLENVCNQYLKDPAYNVKAINFTTHGAAILYVDEDGRRLTPLYNYLKSLPEGIAESLCDAYGGVEEFSRKVATSMNGMLNSGLQVLWLKKKKPGIFRKVSDILHYSQYLTFRLTGQVASEYTSIGCHSALWDYDRMQYHEWVEDEGLNLPEPVPASTTFPSRTLGSDVPVGVGMHDSSASLVPYLKQSEEAFILISTGTWCVSMNPFNHNPLTQDQLNQGCLAFLSILQKPVVSSLLFLGHIHDVNVQHISEHFRVRPDTYKTVQPDLSILARVSERNKGKRIFFPGSIPLDYIDRDVDLDQFPSFSQAYHQLMVDLTDLAVHSIRLVMAPDDITKNLYISGGFAKNPLFVNLIATRFRDKKVYTSEIANATSLGAALVVWKCFGSAQEPQIELGLQRIELINM